MTVTYKGDLKMKQKISSALAASLIVGQMQGVALAENTTNVDVTKAKLSQSLESIKDNTIIDEAAEATEQISTEDGKEESALESIADPNQVGEEETEQDPAEDEKKESATEAVIDSNQTGEVEEEAKQEKEKTITYKRTGKLELDLNFSLPIKHTN